MSSTADPALVAPGPAPAGRGDVVRVARVVPRTAVEGPGDRTAVWVQGCSLRCPGCFNPHLWSTRGGRTLPVGALVEAVAEAGTGAVTFLGGEPFDQALALAQVAADLQSAGASVMTFTGYEYEHLVAVATRRPDVAALLRHTDLLVDGPYLASLPDRARPWVGSTNQRFHFLSPRERELSAELPALPDGLEVRVTTDGTVLVNGWAEVEDLDLLLDTVGRRVR